MSERLYPKFAMAVAACALACSPILAKPKLVADIAGAKTDSEFRCVSQWMALIMLTPLESADDRKAATVWIDRLDPFTGEVQNHMIDRYHLGKTDFGPIFGVHRDATKAEYDRDPKAASSHVMTQCVGFLSAREAARSPTSPQRCWALQHAGAMGSMLTAAPPAKGSGDVVTAMMPGMVGMLGTVMWRKWAKAELLQSGKSEKEAEKLIMTEKKAVDKDMKSAMTTGRAVVFDKPGCQKQYDTYRASKAPAPANLKQ